MRVFMKVTVQYFDCRYSTTLGDNTASDDNMTTSNNVSTLEAFSHVAVNTSTGLFIWLPGESGWCMVLVAVAVQSWT